VKTEDHRYNTVLFLCAAITYICSFSGLLINLYIEKRLQLRLRGGHDLRHARHSAIRALRAPPTEMLAAWTRSSSYGSSKRQCSVIPIGSARRAAQTPDRLNPRPTTQIDSVLIPYHAPAAALPRSRLWRRR
jgi:hypothetical protein